jgi:hypothetical protein
MLRVYVAEDCPTSDIALGLVEKVRAIYPDLPVQVIDVDAPEAPVPDDIFGTPIYTWNNRVLFLGNPSEATLIDWARGVYD